MPHEPGVFWITLIDFGMGEAEKRSFRIVFECKHAADVARLAEELREFGVVNGTRLRVAAGAGGGRVVERREPFVFGAAAVGSIQPYLWPLREAGQ